MCSVDNYCKHNQGVNKQFSHVLKLLSVCVVNWAFYSKIYNYLYTITGEVRNADRIWACTPQNLASGVAR